MTTTIRCGSFETNSSSTHALVMMNEDEYRDWKRGELIYSNDTGTMMTKDDVACEYEDYVIYNGFEFAPKDDTEWMDKFMANSLNDSHSVDSNYGGMWIDDEQELNGVHAVLFDISNDC